MKHANRQLLLLVLLVALGTLAVGQSQSSSSKYAVYLPFMRKAWDPDATVRISVASDGTQGNRFSYNPAISGDGRYVVFRSKASNLVDGDTNSNYDIFVHDTQTGTTKRVSVDSNGAEGNSDSNSPSISGNGRYVAFASYASDLVVGDTNGRWDVFIHDTQTGTTERMSVTSDGTQGNSGSYDPSISADGRYVAFASDASNLVVGDTNSKTDIFVHDTQTDATERVSVDSNSAEGNRDSGTPSISADGRYVAFESNADNLVDGDINGYQDIFVHDTQTGTTMRVSLPSDGTEGNSDSNSPAISADGRYVAFRSAATNLVDADTNDAWDVFVHDVQIGATERVSVRSDGTQGDGNAKSPAISADGRYVTFHSLASNLVPGDTNSKTDIFVHDRDMGTTERISVAADGTEGDGDSSLAAISGDGRYVAFASNASNLVDGDTNGRWDIFIRDRGALK